MRKMTDEEEEEKKKKKEEEEEEKVTLIIEGHRAHSVATSHLFPMDSKIIPYPRISKNGEKQ